MKCREICSKCPIFGTFMAEMLHFLVKMRDFAAFLSMVCRQKCLKIALNPSKSLIFERNPVFFARFMPKSCVFWCFSVDFEGYTSSNISQICPKIRDFGHISPIFDDFWAKITDFWAHRGYFFPSFSCA